MEKFQKDWQAISDKLPIIEANIIFFESLRLNIWYNKVKINNIHKLDDIEEKKLTLKAILPIGIKVINLDERE